MNLSLNPWASLPKTPPFVLPQDAGVIEKFNEHAPPNKRYDLSLMPEPFFGNPLAPVIALALNPGWSPSDADVHAAEKFRAQSRDSLTHRLRPHPFLHLQPDAVTPGAQWWNRIARKLIDEIGIERMSAGLMCVQYFPYHSVEYKPTGELVPSQAYGFALVRAAMERGADVIIMRSGRQWRLAVPALASYARIHHVINPRNPTLSPGNLAASFDALLKRLREAV